jgi:quercetin dioxygenase-like cupin family protein
MSKSGNNDGCAPGTDLQSRRALAMKGINELPAFISQFTEADVPFEDVKAWLVESSRCQVVVMAFSETADVPEHSHQEQWELVLAGTIRLRREGEEAEFRAGDNFFIPAGVVHSAKVSAGYQAIMIFNQPNRYKPKLGSGAALE